MPGLKRAPRPWLVGALILLAFLNPVGRAQRQHLVMPGDTLFALAARYRTTVMELRRVNSLDGDLLRTGSVLELPGPAGFRDVPAAAGETMAEVAARVGLSLQTLRSANPEHAASGGLADGALLRVPPADGLAMRFEEGDSLLELAIRHGAAPADLLRVNGLNHLGEGVPGGWLLIPAPAAADGQPAAAGIARTGLATTIAAVAPVGATGAAWHADRQSELLRGSPALLARFVPLNDAFVFPLVGTLSSRFGWRNISVAGNRFHGGIDLAVDSGTPVTASGDGLVVRANWIGAYGYAIYVDHADGVQTRYAHLSRLLVGAGELVRQGDVIGLAGSTGASTGPHLHFELRVAGHAVDPLPLLR